MPRQKRSRIRLSDALKDHCERQTARLLEDFRAAFIGRERDGVHNLRVDIKRLRAYVRLIERITPSFDARASFKPIRRLFRSCSALRDIHVQLGFLTGEAATSFPPERLSEWHNELKDREMKARRLFEAEARKFGPAALNRLKSRVAGSLEGIPEGMVMARAEQNLQTQLRRMQDLASIDRQSDKELHKIRIRSKEARYTLEMVDFGRGRPKERAGLNDKLKSVHQALGRWHDRQVAFDRLTDFLQSYSFWPVNHPDEYGAYLNLLRQEKLAALQDFRFSWKELVAYLCPGPPA
jgi:CHAD domain-containing protein